MMSGREQSKERTVYLLSTQRTVYNLIKHEPKKSGTSGPKMLHSKCQKKVNMKKWRILKLSIMLSRENYGSQWSAIEFNTKLKSYSFSFNTYPAPNHRIECHPKFGDDRLAPKLLEYKSVMPFNSDAVEQYISQNISFAQSSASRRAEDTLVMADSTWFMIKMQCNVN